MSDNEKHSLQVIAQVVLQNQEYLKHIAAVSGSGSQGNEFSPVLPATESARRDLRAQLRAEFPGPDGEFDGAALMKGVLSLGCAECHKIAFLYWVWAACKDPTLRADREVYQYLTGCTSLPDLRECGLSREGELPKELKTFQKYVIEACKRLGLRRNRRIKVWPEGPSIVRIDDI